MAGGYELAKAYVSVIASTKGAGAQIIAEMGSAGDSAGAKAAAGFGSKFGSIVPGLVTKALGGISLGAIFGTAFSKGFNRLKAIDVAQAKLRGLGNDADSVKVIMDNASASVKGTAFGLDAAATAAAGAVAAGIEPGERLEAVLKSVSNSAAASGSSMEEMGAIYNKVASVGKAQNDVLAQVADRGIPIYQALADELGKTTEEVFKMASDGKINFETFEKAMTKAAGTVATEMGNTLPGAFANAQAALGRFGANILTGVYPALTQFFLAFQKWMKPVEAFGKVIGAQIGAGITKVGQAISAFAAGFKSTMGDGKRFTVTFEIIREEIARFASAFQSHGSGIVGVAQKIGSFLGTVLPPLLHSFVSVALNIIRVIGSLAVAFKSVLPSFSGAGNGANTAKSAFDILESSIRLLSTGLFQLSEFIENHQQGVGRLVLALGTAVTAYKGVTTAIGVGKSAIESYNTAMGTLSAAKDTVMGVAEGFKMLTTGAGTAGEIAELGRNYQLGATAASVYEVAVRAATAAQTAFNTASANIAGNLSKAFSLMKANPFTSLVGAIGIVAGALAYFFTQTETGRAAWESLMQAIQPAIDQIMPMLSQAFQSIVQALEPVIATVVPMLGQLGAQILQALQPVISQVAPKLVELGGKVATAFGQLLPAIMPAVEAIGGAFSRMLPVIGNVVGQIASMVGPVFEALGPAIVASLQPVIPVVTGFFERMGAWIPQIVQSLSPLIPMFVQFGTTLMQQLAPIGEQIMSQLMPAIMELATTLMSFLPQIAEIFNAIMPVIMQVIGAILAMLPQIVGIFIELVPVVVSVVGAIGQLAAALLDIITSIIPVLLPIFQALIGVIGAILAALLPLIAAIINTVIPIVLSLIEAIMPIVNMLIQILVPTIQMILTVVQAVIGAIVPIIQSAIDIITGIIKLFTSVLKGDWQGAWDAVKQILQGAWDLIKSIVTGAINVVRSIIEAGVNFIKSVWEAAWNGIKSFFTTIMNGITTGVSNGIQSVVNFFRNLGSDIINTLSSLPGKMLQIGSDIMAGIGQGIANGLGAVKQGFNNLLSMLPGWAKDILGIHSPSRVMRDQVGRWIPAGVAVGVENGTGALRDSVRRMANGAIDSVQNSMDDLYDILAPRDIEWNLNVAVNEPALANLNGALNTTAAYNPAPTTGAGAQLHVHVEPPTGVEDVDRFGKRVMQAINYEMNGVLI